MKLNFNLEYSVVESGRKAPEYQLNNDLGGEVTIIDLLKYFRRTLILVADDVLREEQSRGFDKNPVVAVDNVVGRNPIEVKPFGKIEIAARSEIGEILVKIYEDILNKSPVESGLYHESNFVFYNSNPIANTMEELKAWISKRVEMREGDRIRFVNVMPYAGKLERDGVTAQRSAFRTSLAKDKRQRSGAFVRMPNGAYFLTSRAVVRKFKFNSKIRFEWINGAKLDLTDVPQSDKYGRPLRKTFHPNSGRKGSYVYPSIVIRINEGGLK